MVDIVQYLHQLIAEACSYPRGSLERNRKLTEIIFLMQNSGRISRNGQLNQFDYEDVLGKTWLYFCRNLCEAVTAQTSFDPERANVFTWFNSYLKYRICDRLKEIEEERNNQIQPQCDLKGQSIDPITSIPYTSPTPRLIDEIHQWLEDNQISLSRIHLRDCSEANVYSLILHHLVFDISWPILAQKFQAPTSTLSNFYNKQCLPLLKKWYGEQQT